MLGTYPKLVAGSQCVMELLSYLPSLRTPGQALDWCLGTAVASLEATAGLARFWGQQPEETISGSWNWEALDWVEETERRWVKGPSPVGILRRGIGSQYCMAVPLASQRGVLGLIALCHSRPFTSDQEESLLLLARGVGGTLQNLSEAISAQRRVDQLTLLFDVSKAMNSILDVRKLLDEIMHMGQEALGAEACSVLLVDDERQELFFEIAQGEAGAALQQVRLKMDQGVAGWIATHGQPLVINDVSQDPRFFRQVDQQVKFVTRSILGVPLLARGKTIGVIEVLNKRGSQDFGTEDLELLTALAAEAAISIDNARLFQAVMDGYLDTLKALAAAVDAKDPYTAGHIDRVSSYALETGEMLGLSQEEMTALRYGSILHDVGKIGVPDAILCKPGPLTREEFAIMATHTDIGSRMLEGIHFLEEARPIVRYHQETWDGSGYPDGLVGEAIPLGARIIGAVDAFDAMTTDRPYRKALTAEFALGELHKKAGIQFDPQVVDAFAQVLTRRHLLS